MKVSNDTTIGHPDRFTTISYQFVIDMIHGKLFNSSTVLGIWGKFTNYVFEKIGIDN
jgi:hypothetical protein